MHIHTPTYIHIHAYTYTYTYTHIHTPTYTYIRLHRKVSWVSAIVTTDTICLSILCHMTSLTHWPAVYWSVSWTSLHPTGNVITNFSLYSIHHNVKLCLLCIRVSSGEKSVKSFRISLDSMNHGIIFAYVHHEMECFREYMKSQKIPMISTRYANFPRNMLTSTFLMRSFIMFAQIFFHAGFRANGSIF